MRQPADAARQGANDRVSLFGSRMSITWRDWRSAAFPMARQCSIVDLCRPLTNGDGIKNLRLVEEEAGPGARMSNVVLPAELSEQAPLEDPTTLHKQTAVDRFGWHLHVRMAPKRPPKPACAGCVVKRQH